MDGFGGTFRAAKTHVMSALRLLGLDQTGSLPDHDTDSLAIWSIANGSAALYVTLRTLDDEGQTVLLTIDAPVMEPETNVLPLYRALLARVEASSFQTSFGMEGSSVSVTCERLGTTFDEHAIARVMALVGGEVARL